MEYFLQSELFEKLNKIINDKSYEELIFYSKQTKSNEPKHKKKKKKNNKNNENKITETPKQDEKTNSKGFGFCEYNNVEIVFEDFLKANVTEIRMNILAFLKMKKKNYMPHIIWKQTQNKKNCMKK